MDLLLVALLWLLGLTVMAAVTVEGLMRWSVHARRRELLRWLSQRQAGR